MSIVNAHDFVNMTANNFTDYYEDNTGRNVLSAAENETIEDSKWSYNETTLFWSRWIHILGLFIGITTDLLIIIILAFRKCFRTKTYIIILNVAINDLLMLFFNIEPFSWILVSGNESTMNLLLICFYNYFAIASQFHVVIFLIILVSNILMKSDEIQTKHILIATYTLFLFFALVNTVTFSDHEFLWVPKCWFLLFCTFVSFIVVKDLNAYYKRFSRKDSLSRMTKFRLNFAKIYCYNWCFVYVGMISLRMYSFQEFDHGIFIFLRMLSLSTSLLLFIYLIKCDDDFNEAFYNLFQCKMRKTGNEDVVTGDNDVENGHNDSNLA